MIVYLFVSCLTFVGYLICAHPFSVEAPRSQLRFFGSLV